MSMRPVITVRVAKDKVFMGPGVLMLLECVSSTGSVKDACRTTGISYSKAWKIFNLAEEELGYPLILRRPGGIGGGGSVVSEAGLQLLGKYVQARDQVAAYAEEVFDRIFAEEEKSLSLALGIDKGDVVCLTGAGGKTSAMYQIGMEWQRDRVLLTTTTKIMYPESRDYDYIFGADDLPLKEVKTGRILIYGKRQKDGKCIALDDALLEELLPQFDITIIEADGSRKLPLKGYRPDEPCLPASTNVVVGILTTKAIGKQVDDGIVCRPELFSAMVGISPGERITTKHLATWIEHPEGMFGKTNARRVLFFNQVEDEEGKKEAKMVCDALSETFKQGLDRVVFGSVYDNEYKIVKEEAF